ncbi:hypothetical protein [Paenibacillus sp. FSL L8-0708]|uniref:hypothetical protein n=1 Tax=Paenibacillus sp. FSL L8-0708 TaxID=2975311 RepID=UPI0030F830A9
MKLRLRDARLLVCHFDSIKALVIDICSVHSSFSRDFNGMAKSQILNLRKRSVSNIFSKDSATEKKGTLLESSFLELIHEYQDALGKIIINMDYEYDYKHFDFRLRIKQRDSIINKLFHYRYTKGEQGGMPINKCLNDLLGFRILINDFDHTCEEVSNFFAELGLIDYKLFCYDASKEDAYKATHIYIFGENNFFPWELQIWNPIHAERNELSHKEHKSKREYINWPQEYIK